MKRLLTSFAQSILAVLLATGLATVPVQAQVASHANVKIPFAFNINHHQMQPGNYEVSKMSTSFLALRNLNSGGTSVTLVRPEYASKPEASNGKLIFQRDEGRWYLSEVRLAGSSTAIALIQQHGRRIRPEVLASIPSDQPAATRDGFLIVSMQ